MKFIHFFSDPSNRDLGKPVPIKQVLPKWYKESETTFTAPDGSEASGLKKCVPFLDAMMSGYTLVLPVDIFVSESSSGEVQIRWNSPEEFQEFVGQRPFESGEKIPRPAGHHPNHLAWKGTWGIKTPRGWSVLVTHPLNRFDLPFTTTSGIIDSDKYSTSGNLPFFIKQGFTGVIPAGTPIAQLIPIKRSSWTAVGNNKGLQYLEPIQGHAVRQLGNSYKKYFWERKSYQ
jgi:hypothetical protein